MIAFAKNSNMALLECGSSFSVEDWMELINESIFFFSKKYTFLKKQAFINGIFIIYLNMLTKNQINRLLNMVVVN